MYACNLWKRSDEMKVCLQGCEGDDKNTISTLEKLLDSWADSFNYFVVTSF